MTRWAICAVVVMASLALFGSTAQAAPKGDCVVHVWIHAQLKWTGRVIASYHTSCPFAQRVTSSALQFIVNHGGIGNGDFYTLAYSPVTRRWYRVHCEANGNLYQSSMRVDCRAGIGARVVFRASAGAGS